jgi:predicted secreted Zn-dependent protease
MVTMRKISFGWLATMLLALSALLAAPAWADKRVALVIGISEYKVGGSLPQTLSDAEKIRAAWPTETSK